MADLIFSQKLQTTSFDIQSTTFFNYMHRDFYIYIHIHTESVLYYTRLVPHNEFHSISFRESKPILLSVDTYLMLEIRYFTGYLVYLFL